MISKASIYIISGKNPLSAKSGYASYSYNLANLLTSLGYKVEIFCFGEKDQVLKTKIGTINILSSTIFFTVLKDMEMAGLILLAPKLALALKTVIASPAKGGAKQSHNYNQQTIIWGIGPWSLAGAFIKLLKGKKVIFLSDYFTTIKHEFSGTVSALNMKDYGLWHPLQAWFAYITIVPIYSLLERFLLKFSDKIITHYQSSETIITSQFGISNKKYTHLPYVVNLIPKTSHPSNPPLPSNPSIVLVSRHDGRKGINFLLHAFSILNTRRIQFSASIIGEGKLIKSHQHLSHKLKLKNVNLLGFVPNLQPYFKKADLFVFPTIEEGSSALAILEAMKAGLAIVSTNVDGIPEDLSHGKSALLVPPGNPQALANAMEKLLQNPTLARNLGQNAKKSYYQKYNLVKVKKEVSEFLNGL